MCAHVLRASAARGPYTSPHLQDVRERIRVLTPGETTTTYADFCRRRPNCAIVPREPVSPGLS